MTRRLDRKLDAIHAGRYTPDDFIIADAKDADMAFGVAAPWRGRTRAAYLDDMRALVAADALDILLTSASNGERVATDGSLDDEVTPGGTGQRHHRHLEPPRQQLHQQRRRARSAPPTSRPSARSATWCCTR